MYVADAHALAWYFTDDPRLGQEASRVFESSRSGLCAIIVPTIVLAELFHIGRKKRIPLTFSHLLGQIEERTNFVVADLDLSTIKKIPETHPVSELHDKIIVATGLLYGAAVLTKDATIQNSGIVHTVW